MRPDRAPKSFLQKISISASDCQAQGRDSEQNRDPVLVKLMFWRGNQKRKKQTNIWTSTQETVASAVQKVSLPQACARQCVCICMHVCVCPYVGVHVCACVHMITGALFYFLKILFFNYSRHYISFRCAA